MCLRRPCFGKCRIGRPARRRLPATSLWPGARLPTLPANAPSCDPAPTPLMDLSGVLGQTLPALWRCAPALMARLLGVVVLQGLVPAATVVLGKWTIDGVGRLIAGGEGNLTLLTLAWAGAALVGQLTGVASTVLQGQAADHFTVSTVTALMRKMQALPGLDVVEDPQFHDDVETLHTGARFRPLNLVVTLLGLLRAVIGVLGVAGTLLVIGWWVPPVVVLGILPLAQAQIRFREAGWSLAPSSAPRRRGNWPMSSASACATSTPRR